MKFQGNEDQGSSQLRQNYLNNYFQARVGKEMPKSFPDPLSVGKLDVGKFCILKYCKHSASQKLPKLFSGRARVASLFPD